MSKYVVVDLEMCKVPNAQRKGNYRWSKETIQIGAVLLNESLEIEDSFVRFVSPQYGFVDTYINKLTGISRYDVSKASNMNEVLHEFVNWIPTGSVIVSWSASDKNQIFHEINAKEIIIDGMDDILNNWMDCQEMFAEKMNCNKKYKLSEALVAADIVYEDGAHNGLTDAYNTALLFVKMQREPELVLNTYYQKAILSEESSSGFTMGSLFVGLDFGCLAVA